ncbi:FAD-dependent oxidoreductase [Rubrivirga sp. S365]|uniref:FAD-dependent oxidoreductase n=1 Tax=Rubrivirga litoralis TaxID=3075598 RepID=A0ABU3BV68_9BACT|nr:MULTISPECIES: FAD-dependent oxidoreductase [unclassified Rubrivirga]MDT0633184.1 FAD-dependent oxidoreductase [Rubrivirga sp. F394]MDT7857759.1 FAD-dependent oxidoreductase [Rubrivirga sp. S365]
MPDFVRVASVSDLADGEMRQVSADGTDVLLSRVDGRFHACTAFCTHYGAPLATGALSGTTVVCPWHHAAFDVASGALCEPPALDALRTFEVKIEGDDVLVRVPADADEHGKGVAYRESDGETPGMAARTEDDRLFLVLGAGAAAGAAAEALRTEGYRGRLALVTMETRAPYDRTKLSKAYLAGDAPESALPLRDGAFYEKHGIEVWTDRTVTGLDADAREVSFEGGEPVTYDACLVATGGTPRRLPIDGADLDGVLLLRSWADAQDVVEQAGGAERVVVIGASFIGMEAASSLNARGVDVTVVGKSDAPFASAMGADVGRVFQRAAESKGVAFRLGAGVDRIEAADSGGLRVVVGGEALPADAVVMGVGVSPATGFLDGAPFRRDDGGLVTDAALRLAPGLFAAGDVAAFPDARLGKTVRIEHWRLAQQHGRAAARNMLAEGDPTVADTPFDGVPYFWTGQFGLSLRYVGHAEDWDEVVVDGSLDDAEFLAAYVEGGAVRAVAAVGRDQDAAAFHLLMAQGRTPTPADIRQGVDLQARL